MSDEERHHGSFAEGEADPEEHPNWRRGIGSCPVPSHDRTTPPSREVRWAASTTPAPSTTLVSVVVAMLCAQFTAVGRSPSSTMLRWASE